MQKSIYVSDTDRDYWGELGKIGRRKGLSISALLSKVIRDYVDADRRNLKLGLPAGFRVPASMKDPRVIRAETFADEVRERVLAELLETIQAEDEVSS